MPHGTNSMARNPVSLEGEMALKPCPPIEDAVQQAHREWLSAIQYFEAVSDPELVDHAIYMITAAERKYMYLLQQVGQDRS